jgi:hypothetical protein
MPKAKVTRPRSAGIHHDFNRVSFTEKSLLMLLQTYCHGADSIEARLNCSISIRVPHGDAASAARRSCRAFLTPCRAARQTNFARAGTVVS